MKLPPVDLNGFLKLLKSEGRTELAAAAPRPKFGEIKASGGKPTSLTLFQEWDNIIAIVEHEVIPLLSKGCEAKALAAPAKKLAKSAGSISLMASQVLSFVPGPIGILCSLVNAIVCFSAGNVVGGLFELLGCIPGGKVAGKAGSKLFPKIEKIMIEMVQSNHSLRVIVETSSGASKTVTEFFQKHAPKFKPKKADVGQGYGVRTPAQPSVKPQPSILEQSLSNSLDAQRQIGTYRTFPNSYGNMPKHNPWSHLGY